MRFSGDIIITDPCYVAAEEEDWDKCEYGEEMDAIGIPTFWTHDGGDCVGSDIILSDTQEKIGEFCSDSCMVSVMALDEVLHYNPGLLDELGSWCYTIIRGFEGEVDAVEVEDDEDQYWKIVGKGNINFESGIAKQ